MARYTGAVCKMCRREGKKLYLKGERCYSNKCAFERRSYAPGQHGQSRKRPLNTVCSSERSSRLSVTTVFRKASSTSISSWLSARRVSPVKPSSYLREQT